MKHKRISPTEERKLFIGGICFTLFFSEEGVFIPVRELREAFPKSPITTMVPNEVKAELKWIAPEGDTRRMVLVSLAGVLSVFSRIRDKCFFRDAITKFNVSVDPKTFDVEDNDLLL